MNFISKYHILSIFLSNNISNMKQEFWYPLVWCKCTSISISFKFQEKLNNDKVVFPTITGNSVKINIVLFPKWLYFSPEKSLEEMLY